jgi:hypothetical protein
MVTQRHWVNSSQLLCEPNRAPFPDALVPPNGAYASLFRVWSLTCAAIEAFRQHLDVPEPPLLAHLEAAARALQVAAAEIAADGPTAAA